MTGYSGGYYTVEWGQISKEVISPHNRFFRKIIIFKLTWPVCFRESSSRKAFLPRSHTLGRTVGVGLIVNRKAESSQCSPQYRYNSHCVFYSWRVQDFLKIQSSSNTFISIHNIRVLKNASFLKTSIPLWHVIRCKSMRPEWATLNPVPPVSEACLRLRLPPLLPVQVFLSASRIQVSVSVFRRLCLLPRGRYAWENCQPYWRSACPIF